MTPYAAIRHPSAAPFAFAGVKIEIKSGDRLTIFGDAEITYVSVVARRLGIFFKAHTIETLDHLKQTIDHAWRGKVRAQLLLRNGVARFAQFFTGVSNIPRF